MPDITNVGSAPEVVPTLTLAGLMTAPTPVTDRVATPVRPLMVTYPNSAASRGLEGICEVSFDITPQGLPYNVEANCTHRVFEDEARRAVSRSEFLPQIINGHAVETHRVVYPLEFRLNSE